MGRLDIDAQWLKPTAGMSPAALQQNSNPEAARGATSGLQVPGSSSATAPCPAASGRDRLPSMCQAEKAGLR
jgi:hypothetical protein